MSKQSDNPSGPSRFISLQILRGLAAWTVVFHHFGQTLFMGSPEGPILQWFWLYGHYGVDAFFVLSGIVMAHVSTSYNRRGGAFALNRIVRVIPVYWFYTFLLVACVLVLPKGTYLTGWTPETLAKSLAFLPSANPNGHGAYPTLYVGWSLVYEMFFYMVFALVLALRIPAPALSCAVALAILSFLIRQPGFLGFGATRLLEFSLGMFIQQLLARSPQNRRTKIASRIAFGVVLLTAAWAAWGLGRHGVTKYFLASACVYLLVLGEDWIPKQSFLTRFLIRLGDYSYSTYLCHIIVIGWAYAVWHARPDLFDRWALIPPIIIVTFLISKYSYLLIERNSSVQRLQQLLSARSLV